MSNYASGNARVGVQAGTVNFVNDNANVGVQCGNIVGTITIVNGVVTITDDEDRD